VGLKVMDRQTAELLMKHLDSLDQLVGAISETLARCPPSEEIKAAEAEAFRASYDVYACIARCVLPHHPDLDRDK